MESIWTKTCKLMPRAALTTDKKVEVAVIGAGMTGVLVGKMLQDAGFQVILLEANTIGSGQTANTTGKITAQHGMFCEKLILAAGTEKASAYVKANLQAVEDYATLISNQKIDCNFEKKDAYLFARKNLDILEKEQSAAEKLGLSMELLKECALPFPVAGVLKLKNQAQFHPLKFLQAIAAELTIYEKTPVLSVKENVLHTSRHTVTAEHIIFACHFPFVNVPGYYFARMHQSRAYLLALEGAALPEGIWISAEESGYTLRTYNQITLFGGEDHRTGENPKGTCYEKLREAAKQYFPSASEIAAWSAQDCMTHDHLPYVGKFAKSEPNWYIATGFGKWGMSNAMVAATLLCKLIQNKDHPAKEVLSPARFHLAAIPDFMKDGAKAVSGLTKSKLFVPDDVAAKFAPGTGGLAEGETGKVGVYRNEEGEIYTIHPVCPHLGCQLEWNADEKSWDCPCHGSRFDYKGNVLDGPAQEGLLRG